jgi:hypothetical protein
MKPRPRAEPNTQRRAPAHCAYLVHTDSVKEKQGGPADVRLELHVDALGLGVGRERSHNVRHQPLDVIGLLVQLVLAWIGGCGQ